MLYTQEFEYWWISTYQNKLGPIAIELSFKEVAYKAWQHQQAVIDNLIEEIDYCEEKLSFSKIPSGIIGYTI